MHLSTCPHIFYLSPISYPFIFYTRLPCFHTDVLTVEVSSSQTKVCFLAGYNVDLALKSTLTWIFSEDCLSCSGCQMFSHSLGYFLKFPKPQHFSDGFFKPTVLEPFLGSRPRWLESLASSCVLPGAQRAAPHCGSPPQSGPCLTIHEATLARYCRLNSRVSIGAHSRCCVFHGFWSVCRDAIHHGGVIRGPLPAVPSCKRRCEGFHVDPSSQLIRVNTEGCDCCTWSDV